jgi:hypothetical protein
MHETECTASNEYWIQIVGFWVVARLVFQADTEVSGLKYVDAGTDSVDRQVTRKVKTFKWSQELQKQMWFLNRCNETQRRRSGSVGSDELKIYLKLISKNQIILNDTIWRMSAVKPT